MPGPRLLAMLLSLLDLTASATAEGEVTFNANPLGSAVKGVRVRAAALTLDPPAPPGISQISGPLLFVL